VDILQVLEGVTYLAFITGAIFAVIELRTLSKDRKTDLYARFNEHWSSKDFEEAFIKIRYLDSKDPREMERICSKESLWMVVDYVSGIAEFARDNLVDRKWVLSFCHWELIWDRLKPWVLDMRETIGNPYIGDGIEWGAKMQKEMGV
jgi:hypothetical protein